LPIGAIKECFVTLDLEIDEELMDYLMFVIYQKSESVDKMNYGVLLELIEGKEDSQAPNVQNNTADEATGKRKRPESSSPPKIKDRNKDKF